MNIKRFIVDELEYLKGPACTTSPLAIWASKAERHVAPPPNDMFRFILSYVTALGPLFLLWYFASEHPPWEACSVFQDLKSHCPCSFRAVLFTAFAYFLFIDAWFVVQLFSLLPTLMGSRNVRAELVMLIVTAISLYVSSGAPTNYLDLPQGITYGFHLGVQFATIVYVTSRVGPWNMNEWRRANPVLFFLLGYSSLAGIVVGGQQVIFLLLPSIISRALTFVPLILSFLEFMWVYMVGLVVHRHPNATPEVAATLARLIVSTLEGLRAGLLLGAIRFSPSVFEGPFLEALVWGVVLEVLGRNKVLGFALARLRGSSKPNWSSFKKLTNGVKFDVNYSSNAMVLVLAVTQWSPLAITMGCNGRSLSLIRPDGQFILAMLVSELVTDISASLLTKVLQYVAFALRPTRARTAKVGHWTSVVAAGVGGDDEVVTGRGNNEEKGVEEEKRQKNESNKEEVAGVAAHYQGGVMAVTGGASVRWFRPRHPTLRGSLLTGVEDMLDTCLFCAPSSHGGMLLSVMSSLAMSYVGITGSLLVLGRVALVDEDYDGVGV